jgi:arachidonate 15-lipoxygenase
VLQMSIRDDKALQAWAEDLATNGHIAGMPTSIESVEQLTDIVANVIFICGPQHSAVNFTQVRPRPTRIVRTASACAHALLPVQLSLCTAGASQHLIEFSSALGLQQHLYMSGMQAPYGCFVPNFPLAARASYNYLSQRTAAKPITERELARMLPDRQKSMRQIFALSNLSAYHFDQLGHYDKSYQSVFSWDADKVFEHYGMQHLHAAVQRFGEALAEVGAKIDAANAERKQQGRVEYPYLHPAHILNSISI